MFRTDLVPHIDFHKGYWFKSNLSDWYYFKEQERPYNIPEFFNYSLLDKDLLSLVIFLHKKNIPTTPSCSGHFLSEDYFTDLFQKIKIEEHLIRSVGLELKNIETQETIKFKDEKYTFVYPQRSFIKLAQPYSKQGILGVLGDFSYINSINNLNVLKDGDITLFHAVKDTKKVWNELLSVFISIWEH